MVTVTDGAGSLLPNTVCFFVGYFLLCSLFEPSKIFSVLTALLSIYLLLCCPSVMTTVPALFDYCLLDYHFCLVCLVGYSLVIWICLLNAIKLLPLGSHAVFMSSPTAPSQ